MSRGLDSGIGHAAKSAFEGISSALSEVLKNQGGGGGGGGGDGGGKSASGGGMGDAFDFAKLEKTFAQELSKNIYA